MIKQIKLLFFLFFLFNAFAQSDFNQKALYKGIEENIYNNPDQSLKVASYLIERQNLTDEEESFLKILIAKAYITKGDYGNALLYLYPDNYKVGYDAIENYYLRIFILNQLQLEQQQVVYFNELKKLSETAVSSVLEKYNTLIILETSLQKAKKNYISESVKTHQLVMESSDFVPYEIDCFLEFIHLDIRNKRYDLASEKIKHIDNFEVIKNQNYTYYKIQLLLLKARLAFYSKQYKQALEFLNEASAMNALLGNKYFMDLIFNQQTVNYLAVNNVEGYKESNKNFQGNHNNVQQLEQKAVNTVYNLIVEENSRKASQQEMIYFKRIKLISILVLIGFILFASVWFKNYLKITNLKEIISYLKITKANLVSFYKEDAKKNYSSKILIPKKTEELILNKLQKFEKSTKYTSKDLSLAILAGQFDTNTKYLSEIINSNYHVNYNTYINQLRINYIVDKLKTDTNYMNYKISYLADECGFASHSSFATVFKSITGISPVKFISLLKAEQNKEE
jgi:AraC-like DNA-binding protein